MSFCYEMGCVRKVKCCYCDHENILLNACIA